MNKPLHPCNQPGCHETTRERYCERHKKTYHKRIDDRRGTPAERGYDKEWRKVRYWKLINDPLCERCYPKVIVAEVVHHKDHDQYNNLEENLESLCRDCHEKEHGRKADKGCDVNGMPTNKEHPWNRERER